jgi:hypothetical protein
MNRILQITFFSLFLGGLAAAQSPPPPGDQKSVTQMKDAEGFEPVNGDMMQQGESIPASRLVGAAYGFIFAAVVVWVASVARRARRLEGEVDDLKRKLDARG